VHKGLGTLGTVGASLIVFASAAMAAGFGAHVVGNSTTFSSATLQLEGITGSNCYSTGSGSGGTVSANSSVCATGSPLPVGSLSSTVTSTATTTLNSVGNVNASAAEVSSPTCGVAQLADAGTNVQWSGSGSNTALVFNGITYQATGPMPGSQGISTDGSTGWAETTASYVNPETFTVLVWFKTSSPSGALIGFGSQSNPVISTPATHDRQLWVDSAGKLVWGLYNGGLDQVTSSTIVTGGSWEFAAATVGSAGQLLYVNGASVGSGTTTNTSAQSFTGWWSLGYASLAGWADIPANYYFNGSIAQVAVIPSQLTASQISTLWGDRTVLSTYTSAVNALSPVDAWALGDSGSVPYLGPVPGATASTTLADASGNGNTGSAQGGVTLGAAGPTALGGNAVSLNGSSGYVQTSTSSSNPEGFSTVAWFKTSSASGGTIIGFTDTQGNGTPGSWDRVLWLDNTGKLVWGVYNGTTNELTSASAYNNGSWHMAVAEIGPSGQQLWVDGTRVGLNASVTTAQSYTGYWHLGWGYEASWADPPTSSYLSGSLAQVAIVPTQLSASGISNLYANTSAADYALDMGALSSTSYWPLGDSMSNVCGTGEVTVQQTVGSTNTCIYPAAAGTCAAVSSAHLINAFGSHSITAPTSATAVAIKIVMELSAASGTSIKGLHMLPAISFATTKSSTLWSAQISYSYASVML
jgi:hypothetical protein